MTGSYPKSSRAAWTAVAVLGVVAFLYYLDRLLLTSMRDAVRLDLGMTDAQFGLLTSSFLWIYGVFGPLGGLVADRFGRRPTILASLAIWSAGLFFTGQARSFHALLGARILMGISEACFLPTALALISNHHRSRTRSLATGLFNIGLYAGSALGGIGGWFAERYSWRTAFTALGVIGVVYTALAAITLEDASSPDVPPGDEAKGLTAASAMRGLLASSGFRFFVGVFCIVSMANWLFYGWLPTYLRERFHLSHALAGLSATGYVPLGAVAGVVLGGLWADRWNRQEIRARTWVAATGIAIAAPAFYLAGLSPAFLGAIAGLLLFGVGRGFFDANCMPILREISAEKYSATGYGLLNMTGCLVGGLTTYGAGALLDAKIPLGVIFRFGAIGMAVGAVALARLKPGSR
jgi:predicted MFS family arabinose efflux permease